MTLSERFSVCPDATTASDTSCHLPPPRPGLLGILARVVANVVIVVLVPAALLWATLVLFDFPAAVIVALAWMAGVMSWRWATRRPVSGLLLLTLVILTVRTTLTLITGSTFFYFVQPVFADVTVAVVFLGSLATARPVIARLAPDFYPMDAALTARPRMRALFRGLTLMWGLVILLKAAITLSLLESLPTADFVLIKGSAIAVLTVAAAGVTLLWALAVGHREGLVRTAAARTA